MKKKKFKIPSDSQLKRMAWFQADYAVSQNCKNLEESYGEVCVKCKKCGRKFDNYGVLLKDKTGQLKNE